MERQCKCLWYFFLAVELNHKNKTKKSFSPISNPVLNIVWVIQNLLTAKKSWIGISSYNISDLIGEEGHYIFKILIFHPRFKFANQSPSQAQLLQKGVFLSLKNYLILLCNKQKSPSSIYSWFLQPLLVLHSGFKFEW